MPATLAIISKIFHKKKERICILFVAHSSVQQFSKDAVLLLRGGRSVKHVRPTHPPPPRKTIIIQKSDGTILL